MLIDSNELYNLQVLSEVKPLSLEVKPLKCLRFIQWPIKIQSIFTPQEAKRVKTEQL